MTELTFLDIGYNSISDISALSGLTKLTTLGISSNSISDISALSKLTKLTSLGFGGNPISDISALSKLTELTNLGFGENSISDISALSKLTKLTSLSIGENSISDMSALSGLTELTFLSFGGNPVSDISALSGLTKLTSLYLTYNSISDISSLSGLTELTTLQLGNNPISDISALSGLTKLEVLALGGEGSTVSDISALSGLTKLTELHLDYNAISDISALSGLTKLTFLNLSGNAVSDISSLTGLTKLTYIILYHNSLNYASINTHIPALQANGASVYFTNRTLSFLNNISGTGQTGKVNTALTDPFVVEVLDNANSAFEGVPVSFSVTPTDGSLSITQTTTDADGRAETLLTLGSTSGTYTVTATVGTLTTRWTATATTGLTPTRLVAVSGDGQTDTVGNALAAPLVVRVLDQNGNAMSGRQVSFSVTPSDGSLNPTSGNTDSDGETQTKLTLGNTPGTYTVTATVGTLTTRWTATATAKLTPTRLVAVSGDGQTGTVGNALAAPLVVRVLDQNGNAMSGRQVSFSVTPSDGSLNPTSGATDSDGETQTKLTLGSTTGTYTVTATVGTLTTRWTATATAKLTPTRLVAVSGDGQTGTVGNALAAPLVVRVLDQNGNAMSGRQVSFSVTPSDGSLNPTSGATDSDGETQTKLTLGSTTGTYTVTATVGTLTTRWTATATAKPPATLTPTRLVAVSGDGQTGIVGNVLAAPLVVRVLDQNGGVMSGRTVSFSVTPSDGSLNPTNGTTDSNGQTQTELTLGSTTGTYTVTATVGTLTTRWTATATSRLTPTRLVAVSGDGQTGTVGNVLAAPLVVRVLNQNGGVMSGRTVSFSVTPSDGSLNPTSGNTDSDGETQTELTLGSTPGTYTVTATVGTLTTRWTATANPVSKPDSEGNVQEEESQQPPSNEQTTEEPTQVEQPTIPPSKLSASGQIGFSELMFASKGGIHSLPQWIELYNNSATESVNLRDWQLTIEARDADGTHRHTIITLVDMQIPSGKTALIVTSAALNSGGLSTVNIYNVFEHHSNDFEQNQHRNMVLGLSGFYLKLSDSEGGVSDTAGNLDGDAQTTDKPIWDLPNAIKDTKNRVSFLRRYSQETVEPLDGTKLNNFKPASEVRLSGTAYWGRRTDIGNPGHRGERVALPVILSVFRAEHTDTGVFLKWITESEVDNAGFYIYRSQTKDGEYKVINQNMILGAGTTGERTEYTWTDATAKPNTVYYYRIEDVSHAGEREQLATVRLRGFVSATGKRITRWADLKMSN